MNESMIKQWALAGVLGVGLVFFGGCDREKEPLRVTLPEGQKRVGVLLAGGAGDLPRGVSEGAEAAANKAGLSLQVFSKSDSHRPWRDSTAVLGQKEGLAMHGWIVMASGQQSPGEGVEKAMQRQAPVVLVDYWGQGEAGRNFLASVGTNEVLLGRRAAEEMVKLVGGAGRIFLLRGGKARSPAKERESGFLELMRRQMNIQVVSDQAFGGDTPESAQAKSEELQKEILECRGVFCSTPEATLGMLRAFKRWGMAGKRPVVGIGAGPALIEALQKKELQLLLVSNPKAIGEEALRLLENYWNGTRIPPHREVPMEMLTPLNVDTLGARLGLKTGG